jgi:hypothetical protein
LAQWAAWLRTLMTHYKHFYQLLFLWKTPSVDTGHFSKLYNQSESVSHYCFQHSLLLLLNVLLFPVKRTEEALGVWGRHLVSDLLFFATFLWLWNWHQALCFLEPHLIFSRTLFGNIDAICAQNGSKRKKAFWKCFYST